ncbi:MAG: glycosyltransferase family 2 protein [Elusimicrobiales bacterium]|nr:glycosyltransferase family 2 protein [Elusimicrobiales bacterium]
MRNISIIVPVYNEEKNIKELYIEILSAIKEFELIFIDDGSTDKSWNVIKDISKNDSRVKGIRFARNFGQTAAMKAGIKEAKGDIIITMDGDLQNDPNDIPMLLKKIDEGYDLVNGWRKNRKDPFFTRIIPSRIANWLISWVTGIKLNDYGCSLKAYRKDILAKIDLYGEMHRFIPAMCGYAGADIIEVEVNHRPRTKGKSKYGIMRVFKVLLDLMVVKFMGNFMTKPVYFFGVFSFCSIFISAIFFLITIYNKWYNHIFVKDQPLFIVAIFLSIIGVLLGLIGVIAEMLTRIYYSSGKSDYYIKEKTDER